MPFQLESLEAMAALHEPLHLALGVFDGVHLGHQSVIAKAVESARREGGMAIVVTFSPHPIEVIAPEKAPHSLLANLKEKAAILKSLGIDCLVVIPFDHDFAKMEAEDFIRRLTAGNVKTIAVGEDWRFGKHRVGDIALLRKMGEERGFRLKAMAPVLWEGERISSTRIRQAIHEGDFHAAQKMLGRDYEILGTVIEGKKLGRTLGFPTANLRLGNLQTPRNGVWAVKVDDRYHGVANLGTRPSVGGKEKLLEVHLFDFSGDLYGKVIKIRFEKFIREEQKFDSLEKLTEQITKDCKAARFFFKA